MIEFVILGEAHAKGRPRFRNVGKFVQAYTDKETANYENLVKLSFINSGCEAYLNSEPLKCVVNIYKGIPKSTSKKKYLAMKNREIFPTSKPDLDNILKSLFDGLNKVAFKDDSQIVAIDCRKFYSDNPRVEVCIEVVDE